MEAAPRRADPAAPRPSPSLRGRLGEPADRFPSAFGPAGRLEFLKASEERRPLAARTNALEARRKDPAALAREEGRAPSTRRRRGARSGSRSARARSRLGRRRSASPRRRAPGRGMGSRTCRRRRGGKTSRRRRPMRDEGVAVRETTSSPRGGGRRRPTSAGPAFRNAAARRRDGRRARGSDGEPRSIRVLLDAAVRQAGGGVCATRSRRAGRRRTSGGA